MIRIIAKLFVLTVALTTLLQVAPLSAAPVTFVSGTGSDANPCTRAQPCASFFGAGGVDTGGSIVCLDSGPYGGDAEFNRSITIDCAGVYIPDFTGLTQDFGVLTIRNLRIVGTNAGAGSNGVASFPGATLIVENCVIEGFAGVGISITGGNAVISNTRVSGNAAGNILIRPTSNVTASALFNHVTTQGSRFGIKADGTGASGGNINVEVRDSVAAQHANNGFIASSDTGQTTIKYKITRSSATNNGAFGAVASGAQAFMIVDDSSLTMNGTGLGQLNGSTVATYGNNGVNFNTTNTSGTITMIGLH